MKFQRGVTLGSVFFLMMLLGFFAYGAARILPAYMDYWVVKKVLTNTLSQPDAANLKERDIRDKFTKEMSLNNVKTVSADDLVFEPIANGMKVSVDFSVKQAFMGPVNLCMDFHAEASTQ